MQKGQLRQRLLNLCSQTVEELNLMLYDAEYFEGSNKLLVYIIDDLADTASIEDCVKVDGALTTRMDKEDWIPEKMVLEVSSPGIPRKLKMPWHFKRVCGKKIKLGLRDGDAVEGNLLEANDKGIKLEGSQAVLRLDYKNIKKAHLHFVF
ncbi:MAG: hypothetical protein OXB84_04080 [Halobacteriovoraceae bacterium]|nr:hypothetical protein [Halobacteriovoraceae bacterium]